MDKNSWFFFLTLGGTGISELHAHGKQLLKVKGSGTDVFIHNDLQCGMTAVSIVSAV